MKRRKHSFIKKHKNALLIVVSSIVLLVGMSVYISLSMPHAFDALRKLLTGKSATPDYYVLYTKDGFVPNHIDIPVGSRVMFKDTIDAPLWPESDPYPTHTDYPSFNAGKSYVLGQTYTFVFTKTGTFGFHNREDSNKHGSIQVLNPVKPDPDISKTLPSQVAARDKLIRLLKPNDPSSIFTVVDTIEANSALALNCHEIAHDIGHRAYEMYGFSGAMNFSDASRLGHASVQDVCAGGYVHGVLEEAALHQPDFTTNPGAMCAGVSKDDRASCFHGIGHALMFSYGRTVSASLAGCRISGTKSDASRCFEGVWMELFWGQTNEDSPALGWDVSKPLAPCIEAAADAKPACFIYSAFGYLRTHPKDYTGAVKLCTESGLEENDSDFCLKGVGITMISHFKAQHLEQSEPYVTGLDLWQKTAFYQGVFGYARLSGVKETDLQASCDVLVTDKDICNSVLREGK